jgi:hypothetical protein
VPDAAIEREERNDKVVCAAYLSGKLFGAIRRLAAKTGRSQSHVLGDLYRCGLLQILILIATVTRML